MQSMNGSNHDKNANKNKTKVKRWKLICLLDVWICYSEGQIIRDASSKVLTERVYRVICCCWGRILGENSERQPVIWDNKKRKKAYIKGLNGSIPPLQEHYCNHLCILKFKLLYEFSKSKKPKSSPSVLLWPRLPCFPFGSKYCFEKRIFVSRNFLTEKVGTFDTNAHLSL